MSAAGLRRSLPSAALLAAVLFFHLWRLAEVPRGLYVDESSIGLNAALVAESGRDEHGAFLPVYFKAFGEWKNPLHVYAAALLFKAFGVSVFGLRATSVLFFFLFLAGLLLLARRLFPGARAAVVPYLLLAAGFLPWLFTLSRIAFEVISQVAVAAWALFALWRAYEAEEREAGKLGWAAAAGVLLGLSVYSYSTARLLTPLLAAALLAAYRQRLYWRRHAVLAAGLAAALVPYALFALSHPGALTGRFRAITYLYSPALSPGGKALAFVERYLAYFGPDFLLASGDPNLRHGTGHVGEAFVTVAALAAIGLWVVLMKGNSSLTQGRSVPGQRFWTFLALGLAGSPVAAALTRDVHALRSATVPVFLLLFSAAGLARLARIEDPPTRGTALRVVFVVLALEAANYTADYFGGYPQRSAPAFESHGFREKLEVALAQRPREVLVANRGHRPYVHLGFYRRTLRPPAAVPLRLGPPTAAAHTCVLYFRPAETIAGDERFAVTLDRAGGPVKLRCYGGPLAGPRLTSPKPSAAPPAARSRPRGRADR